MHTDKHAGFGLPSCIPDTRHFCRTVDRKEKAFRVGRLWPGGKVWDWGEVAKAVP